MVTETLKNGFLIPIDTSKESNFNSFFKVSLVPSSNKTYPPKNKNSGYGPGDYTSFFTPAMPLSLT